MLLTAAWYIVYGDSKDSNPEETVLVVIQASVLRLVQAWCPTLRGEGLRLWDKGWRV